MSGRRVVVVGGGIAGLTIAWRLLQGANDADAPDVTLLEAGPRFGGRIRTDHVDGFVLEAGPDSVLTTKPWAMMLAGELGLGGAMMGTRPWRHRAFIQRHDRLHPMPDGLSGVVPGGARSWLGASMLSWPGRARAALGRVMAGSPGDDDETIAAFARRRHGREAWDWLIEPLLAGIHGGDGEKLGIASTFPALRRAGGGAGGAGPGGAWGASHASAAGLSRTSRRIRALRSSSNTPAGAATSTPGPTGVQPAFAAPVGGMQVLTDALVDRLGAADLRTHARAGSIERTAAGWRVAVEGGAVVEAESVVLAVPANIAAMLVEPSLPRLAGLLSTIPFASTIVVHAAFESGGVRHALAGHGYLNPRRSGRAVTAVTWTSSKFEKRAPPGFALLRGFIRDDTVASDEEAVSLFLAELRDILSIDAPPVLTRVYRYTREMPQYVLDHGKRVAAIEREAATSNRLHLAGNSYHGVGIADTVHHAMAIANAILAATGREPIEARPGRTGPGSAGRHALESG